MIYNTNIEAQTILINGITYSKTKLPDVSTPEMTELHDFLLNWFNDDPFFTVHTSGSTGTPKEMKVKKEQMMNSACTTCRYFNLNPNDRVLLCLPLTYIAGKMMVVRALVGKLDLHVVSSSGHPLANISLPIRFVAMIPMQVFNSLQDPVERKRMENIDIILLGGGRLDPGLEKELNMLQNSIYVSYGMTETLSHIALRKINGQDSNQHYIPLPSVKVSLSADETLIIDAPLVCENRLITNDIAIIYTDGSFDILGRKDNIVNTGGMKIQIELLEEELKSFIPHPFAISSVSHPKYGEALVLLVNGKIDKEEFFINVKKCLSSYQIPKQIIEVDELPYTSTGKINRAATRILAQKQIDYSKLT